VPKIDLLRRAAKRRPAARPACVWPSQNAQNTKLSAPNRRKIKAVAQEIPRTFASSHAKAKLVSHLARLIRRRRLASNRLVWAALAGTLVWFADQPTVDGYNPLFEMFWNPGFYNIPNWDRAAPAVLVDDNAVLPFSPVCVQEGTSTRSPVLNMDALYFRILAHLAAGIPATAASEMNQD
jgi:hypothetical protein